MSSTRAEQRLLDLLVDAEQVEDRPLAGVVLELVDRARRVLAAELGELVELHPRVDPDRLRALVDQVAQHALGQAQVLVQQGSRRRLEGALLDPRPGRSQVGDVVGELGVARLGGVGAQDEAAAGFVAVARPRSGIGGDQGRHARAQLLAQLVRADLLRDADVVVLRQEDEQAPGDRDLRRQPRALGADRVLDHLDGERLALEDDALDRRRRHRAGRVIAARRAAVDVDVGDVQEGGALEADLDERRLHSRQHARDLADVDVADAAALELAFQVQLLHRAVLDHGDARFLRCPVDEDVLHRGRRFRSGLRPDVDPRPLEQRGRLVQRQTHDTGVAALDSLDPGRRCALDRVGTGLAERLAARDIALDASARSPLRSGPATHWRRVGRVRSPRPRPR